MKRRAIGFFTAVLFAFCGIIARIYLLSENEIWQVADQQSSVTVTVATARGTIYDRHMNPLTNIGSQYRAAILSTPKALAVLSKTMPNDEWETVSERLKTGKPIVQPLSGPLAPTDGVWQFVSPVRYAEDQIAAHVVGYLGDNGTAGVAGIEKAYNDVLSDASGTVTVTFHTDGNGAVLPGGAVTVQNTLSRAKGGVVLTLDSGIQRVVETKAAPLVEKGAVVVMDPDTGDILSLASFPDFEPAALPDYLSKADSPLFDRTTAAYNCGSVFKIVTAAAALENGAAKQQTHTCYGKIQAGANVIHCHYRLGHGTQTMEEAFINSCNPYFISLTQAVGGSSLHRMATSLGFGSGLVLAKEYATAATSFPSLLDLLQPAALANVSFGQGALTATPIHVALSTAAIVGNGKACLPRLTVGTVDEYGVIAKDETQPPVQFFSESTANTLKEMMIRAVENGTGTEAMPAFGGAGGKTGTAETGWISENGSTMVHSWFTGFYPSQNPQYVVTVVCEDAGQTKKNAAAAFREICDGLRAGGYLG